MIGPIKSLHGRFHKKLACIIHSLQTDHGPQRVPDKETDKKIGKIILAIDLLILSNTLIWAIGLIYILALE